MTEQEVILHFTGKDVYKFNGTLSELEQLQLSNNNSYNYIVVQGIIYFVSQEPTNDIRAIALVKE